MPALGAFGESLSRWAARQHKTKQDWRELMAQLNAATQQAAARELAETQRARMGEEGAAARQLAALTEERVGVSEWTPESTGRAVEKYGMPVGAAPAELATWYAGAVKPTEVPGPTETRVVGRRREEGFRGAFAPEKREWSAAEPGAFEGPERGMVTQTQEAPTTVTRPGFAPELRSEATAQFKAMTAEKATREKKWSQISADAAAGKKAQETVDDEVDQLNRQVIPGVEGRYPRITVRLGPKTQVEIARIRSQTGLDQGRAKWLVDRIQVARERMEADMARTEIMAGTAENVARINAGARLDAADLTVTEAGRWHDMLNEVGWATIADREFSSGLDLAGLKIRAQGHLADPLRDTKQDPMWQGMIKALNEMGVARPPAGRPSAPSKGGGLSAEDEMWLGQRAKSFGGVGDYQRAMQTKFPGQLDNATYARIYQWAKGIR